MMVCAFILGPEFQPVLNKLSGLGTFIHFKFCKILLHSSQPGEYEGGERAGSKQYGRDLLMEGEKGHFEKFYYFPQPRRKKAIRGNVLSFPFQNDNIFNSNPALNYLVPKAETSEVEIIPFLERI
jgi:hypothetical protein